MDEEMMETPQQTRKFERTIRIVLLIYMAFLLSIPVGKWIVRTVQSRERLAYLQTQPGYFAHSSYVADREGYEFFYMLNCEKDCADTRSLLTSNVDDAFIAALRQTDTYLEFGEHEIQLYVLMPNEEVSYGVEMDPINSEPNDEIMLRRCAVYIVTIKPEATSLSQCEILQRDPEGQVGHIYIEIELD